MSNRIFLQLIGTMTRELPLESFKAQDGSCPPNLFYVTLGEGSVTLADLRVACLEQLPDEYETQVREWIEHQKSGGDATEVSEIFEDNGVAPVLHIVFVEDEDGEMEKACNASQAAQADS